MGIVVNALEESSMHISTLGTSFTIRSCLSSLITWANNDRSVSWNLRFLWNRFHDITRIFSRITFVRCSKIPKHMQEHQQCYMGRQYFRANCTNSSFKLAYLFQFWCWAVLMIILSCFFVFCLCDAPQNMSMLDPSWKNERERE